MIKLTATLAAFVLVSCATPPAAEQKTPSAPPAVRDEAVEGPAEGPNGGDEDRSSTADVALEAETEADAAGVASSDSSPSRGEDAARRAPWREALQGDDNVHRASKAAPLARPRTAFEMEARARAAFAELTPDERREVMDAFVGACSSVASFQRTLLEYALKLSERDAGLWPEVGEAPIFDPLVHADKQPIPRTHLAPDDPVALAASAQILGAIPPRALQSAWEYDYATRELRRLPGENEPERIFANGLLGMPPQWDLAEALVERTLDDGSLQQTFQAFAHAYTDRSGGVYPGITLYDAHASRADIEMPDVDCLGVIHELLGDWDTWKSMVPEAQHASLYARVGDLFRDAHHHRGLRHNLARTYLCAATELRDGYENHLDRFHALWESAHSDPNELAPLLPNPSGWYDFLQGWSDELEGDLMKFLKGVNRHYTLERDENGVRAALYRVLGDYGAYERLAATAAPSKGS